MEPRMRAVAALGVVAAVVAGLWWGRPVPSDVPAPPVVTVDSPRAITVHVAGAVRRPGLVTVAPDARVAEAVAAAGGAVSGADLPAVNLAAPVSDGQQIVIPLVGASPTGGTSSVGEAGGPLSLNRATAADLEELPGVGPVLAARIIDLRDDRGGFDAVEDLLDVAGIGESKLASLRDLVSAP